MHHRSGKQKAESLTVSAVAAADRPDAAGFTAAFPPREVLRWAGFGLSAAIFGMAAGYLPDIADGRAVEWTVPWIPSLGIEPSIYLDGFSLLFVLLISGIGGLVFVYGGGYFGADSRAAGIYGKLILFMIAMLGLVVAGDLITLFVFWELTTIVSYLLIGTDHENAKARRVALQALLITGIGGLALLAGLVLLAQISNSYVLSDINANSELIHASPEYLVVLALILAGAFTKSAQMPLHFWLPNAMAAPTPISAYLHSATMVKAGVYLLGRLHPSLGGTPEWAWTLTAVGAVTAVGASVIALRQTDLKLALAYSTVMALGTLVLFLGAEAEVAIAAAVTFLLVHALYKCALFLVIGIIDHGTGTREIARLGGLARAMPVTTAIAATAGFSMAGFPPFLGFIGKELKYEGALAIASEPLLGLIAAVSANAMMVALAITVAAKPFAGAARPTPKKPHDPPWSMLLPVAVLSACGFVFGMVPGLLADILVQPAVTAIQGEPAEVELALWHGINIPLVLSVITVLLGLVLFFANGRFVALTSRLPWWRGDDLFERGIDGFKRLCALFAASAQNGLLTRYTAITISVVWLATGGVFLLAGGVAWPSATWPPLAAWVMAAMIGVGLAVVLRARKPLAGIAGLGGVGSGMAGLFFVAGGPDVALTQFLVEVLFVAIAVLVLLRVPAVIPSPAKPARTLGRRLLAAASGLCAALLVLAVSAGPFDRSVTDFFEAKAVPEAFGRNIVNVILVDFRALDTLGEIIVVAFAALAVWALIVTSRKARKEEER